MLEEGPSRSKNLSGVARPAWPALACAVVVQLLLVAAAPLVVAQDQASEGEGIVPPPAGRDIETLRKLLGLPSQPATEPAPSRTAPAPEPPAPAQPPVEVQQPEAPKSAPKAKPSARPAPKRPARPVVKAPPKAAPAPPSDAVEDAAVPEAAAPAEIVQGSGQDIPPPGTVIDKSNLERWKHTLGPSIQWAVSRGATLPVVAAKPTPLEPFREEATRRYSPQVELAANKNSMRNYVAGIPFPLVTEDDPDLAIKLMFNYENRLSVDDVAVRNFACDTGAISAGQPLDLERHYVVDAFRRLFYTSRFKIDPKPTWPTPDGVRYREMLGALHEPFDLKGAGFTYIRYIDPVRHDDSWIYFPQLKRVRRLSTAQRSEGVFGQDVDLDSYAGYAGNPAWSHWTYLGKKTVVGIMNAENLPGKFQKAPAEFFPDDVWEPREVYILLAVSKLGGYNFGQRVLYIDREGLLIPYTEIYDLKGALWKGLVQTYKFGRKPIPGAKRAVYDHEQFFLPSLTMFDIQMNHVTKCTFPSADEKGEEGWYFYFGDKEGTTEEVFSVSHFIETGR